MIRFDFDLLYTDYYSRRCPKRNATFTQMHFTEYFDTFY